MRACLYQREILQRLFLMREGEIEKKFRCSLAAYGTFFHLSETFNLVTFIAEKL